MATNIRTNFIEGESLFKLSKYPEAIKLYDKVISQKGDHVEALYKKGRCLRSIGKYQEAIECFDKTIKLVPNHVPAYNYKGFCLQVNFSRIFQSIIQ
jgi:tetratricopeptide (TPR) repeat protein